MDIKCETWNNCRACLLSCDKFESVFQERQIENEYLSISSMIFAITSIEITTNDNISNSICLNCIDETIRSYKFRQQCINSDNTLKLKRSKLLIDQSMFDKISVKKEDQLEISPKNSGIYEFPNEVLTSESIEFMTEFTESNELNTNVEKDNLEFCNELETEIADHDELNINPSGNKYKCNICEKSFTSTSLYVRHKNSMHSTKKPYNCDICGKGMTRKSNLKEHLRKHNKNSSILIEELVGEKNLKDKNFDPESLKSNVTLEDYKTLTKLPPPNLEDFINGRNFDDNEIKLTQKFLNNPIIEKINGNLFRRFRTIDKRIQNECPICFKLLKNYSGFRSHLETHNTENKYLCDICGEKFTSFTKQREHMFRHSEIHKCDQCQKSFASNSQLQAHIKIHTGEKPFKCDLCDARFIRQSKIKVHKNLVHSDVRPFQCDFCPARCKLKSNLTKHIQQCHSTEKLFKCQFCFKEFAIKSYFKFHLETHSTDKVYNCATCDKTFTVKRYFQKHLKSQGHIQSLDK